MNAVEVETDRVGQRLSFRSTKNKKEKRTFDDVVKDNNELNAVEKCIGDTIQYITAARIYSSIDGALIN